MKSGEGTAIFRRAGLERLSRVLVCDGQDTTPRTPRHGVKVKVSKLSNLGTKGTVLSFGGSLQMYEGLNRTVCLLVRREIDCSNRRGCSQENRVRCGRTQDELQWSLPVCASVEIHFPRE